jgi:hypothetical protein
MTRICGLPGCGRELDPASLPQKRYCSEAHRYQAHRLRHHAHALKTCAGCGRQFAPVKHNQQIYHSRACKNAAYQRLAHSESPRAGRRQTPVLLEDSMTYESYTRAVLEMIS